MACPTRETLPHTTDREMLPESSSHWQRRPDEDDATTEERAGHPRALQHHLDGLRPLGVDHVAITQRVSQCAPTIRKFHQGIDHQFVIDLRLCILCIAGSYSHPHPYRRINLQVPVTHPWAQPLTNHERVEIPAQRVLVSELVRRVLNALQSLFMSLQVRAGRVPFGTRILGVPVRRGESRYPFRHQLIGSDWTRHNLNLGNQTGRDHGARLSLNDRASTLTARSNNVAMLKNQPARNRTVVLRRCPHHHIRLLIRTDHIRNRPQLSNGTLNDSSHNYSLPGNHGPAGMACPSPASIPRHPDNFAPITHCRSEFLLSPPPHPMSGGEVVKRDGLATRRATRQAPRNTTNGATSGSYPNVAPFPASDRLRCGRRLLFVQRFIDRLIDLCQLCPRGDQFGRLADIGRGRSVAGLLSPPLRLSQLPPRLSNFTV